MKKLDKATFQKLQEEADSHPDSDIFERLAAQEQAIFNGITCPRCGEEMTPEIDMSKPFVKGRLLPAKKARCLACGMLLNPYTNLIESAAWRFYE